MFAKNRARALALFTGLVVLTVLAVANRAHAQVPLLSDELRITLPGVAVPIFDNFIDEVGPAAGETSLTFAGGPASVPPPVPLAAVIGVPGVSVIVLTEPVGEVPDPGEVPIIIPGPQQLPVVVSDVIISTLGIGAAPGVTPAVVLPAFITLVSDGGPDMAEIGPLLPGVLGKIFLPETGLLQDLTPFLPGTGAGGGPFGPISVLVQSDVTVPEPSTLLLAVMGASVMAIAWRRGGRRRQCGGR